MASAHDLGKRLRGNADGKQKRQLPKHFPRARASLNGDVSHMTSEGRPRRPSSLSSATRSGPILTIYREKMYYSLRSA